MTATTSRSELHLVDTVHDVIIERVTMDNARDTLHEYWNGDGFVAEAGVYDLLFVDTSASGNTDAGYDIKASNVQLRQRDRPRQQTELPTLGPEHSARSMCRHRPRVARRIWHASPDPRCGERRRVEIAGGSFTDADPDTIVFDVDDSAHLIVRGAYVEHAGAAELSTVEPTASLELIEIVENIT